MTFFIDANVIVYSAADDARGLACRRILVATAEGEADGRTSALVLEEVWHLELSGRVRGADGLAGHAHGALGPSLLAVPGEAFGLALELPETKLGAADRLHAGTCLAHGIEAIVSADRDFDELELPRRVDPLDHAAVESLLGGRAPEGGLRATRPSA